MGRQELGLDPDGDRHLLLTGPFGEVQRIDVYSRYIVGIRVHARESGPLAASMMRKVVDVQGIPRRAR